MNDRSGRQRWRGLGMGALIAAGALLCLLGALRLIGVYGGSGGGETMDYVGGWLFAVGGVAQVIYWSGMLRQHRRDQR